MFELPNGHKRTRKYNWKKLGIKFNDNFDEWYTRSINSNECEKCNKPYKSLRDRQLDHDHNTGEPRNILCNSCNQKTDKNLSKANELGIKYITKRTNDECKLGFTYFLCIRRNNELLINKSSVDLEKLIKYRDEWIKDNPQYF